MKKILIIGGCGYLGTSLYVYLKSIGYEVDTVDIELYGHPSNSKNIKKNYKLLTKSFLDKYGSIVLLAGHSTLGSCENDPADAFENNIKNFIDLLKKLKNQKFIYASTYRVYGNSNKKVSENSNLAFSNYYYDLMKIAIDNFAQISNKNYYSLRMATVNGFSPNLRTNQVINSLLLSAKKNNKIVAYIAIREEILEPTNFKVKRIIDLFGKKNGIAVLLTHTINNSLSDSSLYLDFSMYGKLYENELLVAGFDKLENEDVCLLPMVSSPIENRPNHEFIAQR